MKITPILYTSKKLASSDSKTGEPYHPVMIRVSHEGRRKYVGTGLRSTVGGWDADRGTFRIPPRAANRDELKRCAGELEDLYLRLRKRARDLDRKGVFSFEELEGARRKPKSMDFKEFAEELIERFEKTGKAGNRAVYRTCLNVVSSYHPSKLPFRSVTPKWLREFQEWMESKDEPPKRSTMSVYFRTVRAIYNKAIAEGVAEVQNYPFTKTELERGRKFCVSDLDTFSEPRALTKAEKNKLESYTPKNELEAEAQRVWLFSYYMRGMNLVDLAGFKWSDIEQGEGVTFVRYSRQKTKRRKGGSELTPKLGERADAILDHYRRFGRVYVFGILDGHEKSAIQRRGRVKAWVKKVNKGLKSIAINTGLPEQLTSYWARHSWASILYHQGVEAGKLSEGLDHKDPSVTAVYLKSFDRSEVDKVEDLL